jgi:hypothetical protein
MIPSFLRIQIFCSFPRIQMFPRIETSRLILLVRNVCKLRKIIRITIKMCWDEECYFPGFGGRKKRAVS